MCVLPPSTNIEQLLGMSYEILTKNTVRELTGWSYVIMNLKWHYTCGVFSEVPTVPNLMRHAQVTLVQCRHMMRTLEYDLPWCIKALPI